MSSGPARNLASAKIDMSFPMLFLVTINGEEEDGIALNAKLFLGKLLGVGGSQTSPFHPLSKPRSLAAGSS